MQKCLAFPRTLSLQTPHQGLHAWSLLGFHPKTPPVTMSLSPRSQNAIQKTHNFGRADPAIELSKIFQLFEYLHSML